MLAVAKRIMNFHSKLKTYHAFPIAPFQNDMAPANVLWLVLGPAHVPSVLPCPMYSTLLSALHFLFILCH